VKDKYFSIALSFNGVEENVVVPYNSLTAFADPHAKTSLQFKYYANANFEEIAEIELEEEEEIFSTDSIVETSNVIQLDKFRPKNTEA
jgi:hypothetical protein